MTQNNIKIYKKELSKLNQVYTNKLLEMHKTTKADLTVDLAYFITYLQYVRDKYIIMKADSFDSSDIKLAALAITIEAYHRYKNCIDEYYKVSDDKKLEPKISGTKAEVFENYTKTKSFYWEKFCELLKESLPLWEGELN